VFFGVCDLGYVWLFQVVIGVRGETKVTKKPPEWVEGGRVGL
jgi:hypothetical protein